MLAPLLAAVLAAGPADLAWEPSYGDARARAAAEGRVVFCALNMDGERGNDRTVDEVYTDRRIAALGERTVNVVGSSDDHAPEGRPCPRFGGIECRDHRFVDAALREDVLDPDGGGRVVAPQHVFLAPDGTVLLSVPYEVTADELEWCFVAALRRADPDADVAASDDARPPRRLIVGGVHALEAADAMPTKRAQALELVELHKKGVGRQEDLRILRRLATADEPEARDYVLTALRSSRPGGRGGGLGRAGGRRDGEQQDQRRAQIVRWIGYASPPSWWEVCAEFVDAGDDALRREAVVALEQLGAPESLGVLEKRLRKEKDPGIERALLRAIGSAARDDRGARKRLLKQAEDDRDVLLARSALLALGWLDTDEDVDLALRTALTGSEDADSRAAAALAMALTRRESFLEPLRTALEADPPESTRPSVEAAIAVLEGARLGRLKREVTRVGGDEIPRERLFGRLPGGG